MKYLRNFRVVLLFIILIFFNSCSEMVFRGNHEDIFGKGSVLNINLPLYIEFIGIIVNALLTLLIVRLMKIDGFKSNQPIPYAKAIELKFWNIILLILITIFMGSLAVVFDLYNISYMYYTFLTCQISVLVLTAFNNVKTAEKHIDSITGQTNGSIISRFLDRYIKAKLAKGQEYMEAITDNEDMDEEN